MNRTTAVLATLAILLFAGLSACGSNDSDGTNASGTETATAAETTAAAPAATTAAPATKPAPATKSEAVAVCHKNFDPFIANLRKLNKEVAKGPNYQRYSALMQQLIARYGKLRSLDPYSSSCNNEVQMHISGARLIYVGALFSWKACRKSGSCAKTIAELKKNRRQSVQLTNAAVKGFHKVTES